MPAKKKAAVKKKATTVKKTQTKNTKPAPAKVEPEKVEPDKPGTVKQEADNKEKAEVIQPTNTLIVQPEQPTLIKNPLDSLGDLFHPIDVEWRVQQCGVSNNKPWAMVLAYITNRAIMQRLDDVCGVGNWKNEFKEAPCNSGFMCGISIRVNDEWVTKWDGAEFDKSNDIDDTKTAISNSMKRAAVQWGIGRYLYKLETMFTDCTMQKVDGWHRARTRDRQTIYWRKPDLPKWAIPKKVNELEMENHVFLQFASAQQVEIINQLIDITGSDLKILLNFANDKLNTSYKNIAQFSSSDGDWLIAQLVMKQDKLNNMNKGQVNIEAPAQV